MTTPATDSPAPDSTLEEVLAGLGKSPREIHPKFFYDEAGSDLFERICELEEYYLTRTELAIMRAHAPEMAQRLGERLLLIEYGSGSSLKTPILIDALVEPVAYVPIDISEAHLEAAAGRLAERYPAIEVLPLAADYTRPVQLPPTRSEPRRRAVYFPGSTIGNFAPPEARRFLRRVAAQCGPGGGLLIGVDLDKDPEVLHRAYNDSQGVTAAFNLNLLKRFNRELGADFDLEAFRHRAVYDVEEGRIEMYLTSGRRQTVTIGGARVELAAGEQILTEFSYKYGLERFGEIAAAAGWEVEKVWTDPGQLFSVQYLAVAPAR